MTDALVNTSEAIGSKKVQDVLLRGQYFVHYSKFQLVYDIVGLVSF